MLAAETILPIEREKAKERQEQAPGQAQGKKKADVSPSKSGGRASKGEAAEFAADAADVSPTYVYYADKVKREAPELAEAASMARWEAVRWRRWRSRGASHSPSTRGIT